jgi:deoxyadenosine/deoxycytidine kinase
MTSRIELIGALGSGKTTFLTNLQNKANYPQIDYLYEDLTPISDELQYWLSNKESKSFFIQNVFYFNSFNQIVERRGSGIIFTDYSLLAHHHAYSRTLACLNYLQEIELSVLKSINDHLLSNLPPLTAAIYIKAPESVIVERIAQRSRGNEAKEYSELIPVLVHYLEELVASANFPVFTLDFSKTPSINFKMPRELIDFLDTAANGCKGKLAC